MFLSCVMHNNMIMNYHYNSKEHTLYTLVAINLYPNYWQAESVGR